MSGPGARTGRAARTRYHVNNKKQRKIWRGLAREYELAAERAEIACEDPRLILRYRRISRGFKNRGLSRHCKSKPIPK